MEAINKWLDGKRTYIVAALFALFNFGIAMGWWAADNQLIEAVNFILGALGLSFLRAGVKKSGN